MGFHQHRERALVASLLVSLILWNLPFGGVVLYPFKLLATWMHELSHGLIMLATGAGFDRMEIYRDTSGVAFAKHGVHQAAHAAVAAAGYMGTPLFGALMLVVGQTRRAARRVLAGLGMAMALTAALWVHGGFGVAAVATGGAVCTVLAALASERQAALVVNFIAAQACINALLDVRVLFRDTQIVNGKVVGASDAHNMAASSVGPPTLWAVVWLAWSLVLLYAALRVIYLGQQHAQPAPALDDAA